MSGVCICVSVRVERKKKREREIEEQCAESALVGAEETSRNVSGDSVRKLTKRDAFLLIVSRAEIHFSQRSTHHVKAIVDEKHDRQERRNDREN